MLDSNGILLLLKLENQVGIDSKNTCFDYVDSIFMRDDRWVVKVFVEPVGNFEVSGKILNDVLRFWLELFRAQPKDWDYGIAARYLDQHLNQFSLEKPEDARKLWEIKGV